VSRSESATPLFLRLPHSTIACYIWVCGTHLVCAAVLTSPVAFHLTAYFMKDGRAACVSGLIMIHLGYPERIQAGWPQSRRDERERELAALLSPRIEDLIKT